MLITTKAFAATALLIWLGAIAMAESPEPPPQTPSIKTEQQSDGALKAQPNTNDQTKSGTDAAIGQEKPSPTSEAKGHDQPKPKEAAHEASEFWTIAGRSLKITDTLLVAFTFLLFLATVALFWATRDLVNDAKHNAERQLRAYVFLHELTVTDVALGQRPTANMIFKNTGLTPGTDVLAWAGVWIGNFPLQAELIRATPEFMKTASRRSVGPGGIFTIIHSWNEAVTEQHRQMLQNGTAAVFIWGEVTYVDVFGEKRTTTFRNYYGGDTGLRPGGATTGHQGGNNSD